MAGRTSFGQITESDFSHLLQALSGTPKGRAFLAEYRRRSRPEETFALLDALRRIETTMAGIRDQLQPGRIADELRRVAMTLEIATEGMEADPDGDEPARRMALIARAQSELAMLADSLAADHASDARVSVGRNGWHDDELPAPTDTTISRYRFMRDQLGRAEPSAER